MNKLLIPDVLNHRLEQLLAAAERGDAESCEYRARVLEALARGIKAYYCATQYLRGNEAGDFTSFAPASKDLYHRHPSSLSVEPAPAAVASTIAAGDSLEVNPCSVTK